MIAVEVKMVSPILHVGGSISFAFSRFFQSSPIFTYIFFSWVITHYPGFDTFPDKNPAQFAKFNTYFCFNNLSTGSPSKDLKYGRDNI